MLNKQEKSVMKVIFTHAKKKKGVCMITDDIILESIPEKYELTQPKLQLMLKQMVFDEYFELERARKKDVEVNVITLLKKGEAFEREVEQERRDVRRRFILGLLVTGATTLFAILLRTLLL